MKPLRQITNIRRLIRVTLVLFTVMWNLPNARADFTFTPGHLYSTFDEFGSTSDIIEYGETGTVLGSLTVPSLVKGDELHGIAFGSEGFLYAVKAHLPDSGFSVLALNSLGLFKIPIHTPTFISETSRTVKSRSISSTFL